MVSIGVHYPYPDFNIKPHMDSCIRDNVPMKKESIRQVLAANIARLMATTPGMDTQPAVAKRAGMGQSTVSRILRCEQGATVDMLESLARAFGVLWWELLVDSEETRRAALAKMILGPRVTDERAAELLPPAPRHDSPVDSDRRAPSKRAIARRAPRKRKGKNPPAA